MCIVSCNVNGKTLVTFVHIINITKVNMIRYHVQSNGSEKLPNGLRSEKF